MTPDAVPRLDFPENASSEICGLDSLVVKKTAMSKTESASTPK
jgi:hypothetical protein